MSIQQQVEDARFLASNGRQLSALTLLLTAIAASSRKVFPQRVKKDGDAFRLFLGARLRKLLLPSWDYPEESEGATSGFRFLFKDKQYDVADFLYKHYRCELIHEAELPDDVAFGEVTEGPGFHIYNGDTLAFRLSTEGGKITLDSRSLDVLEAVVTDAECNAAEFGRVHRKLRPKPGVDENVFMAQVISDYDLSPGRYSALRHVVRLVGPDTIERTSDEQLKNVIRELNSARRFVGGQAAVVGLAHKGITDHAGVLSPKGIESLRRIAAAYHVAQVAP